jgi:hypothetical protein
MSMNNGPQNMAKSIDDRGNPVIFLEAISKPWIRAESKEQADEKAQHTRGVCEHFEEACNAAVRPQTGF